MDKELAKVIGAAARRARKALKLTQEDAAERIGVSGEFYARIERGNSLPSVQTFVRMAGALGVTADSLLGRPAPASQGENSLWQAAQPASDPPEIRRLLRLLRKSSPSTLRLVSLLIKELEKHRGDDASESGGEDDEPPEQPPGSSS